jgi:FHA domain.
MIKFQKSPKILMVIFIISKYQIPPSSSQLIIKVGSFITLSQYQAFTNIKNLCDERVKIKIASDAITNHSLYSIGENFLSFLVEDRKLTVFVNKTQPNFETYELNLRKTGQIEIGTKSLQEIHIGRSKKSDILLKGLTVSKIHASIVFQNN